MTFDEINQRFAVISVGNKTLVMELNKNGSIHELWAFEDFRKTLIKETVKIRANIKTSAGLVPGTKKVPLADVWLKSKRGRRYNRLVYAMPGSRVIAGPEDYNGWQGFSFEPRSGDWSLNKKHVREIICAGNEDHFQWVMNWLAALIQAPGRHGWTSIVLRGGQGIGKGHFAHTMVGSLFGPQQYLHILGAGQLTAEFNEHLSGKSLIFADESTWGGDPRAASKLKGLITEDTVPIHRKFLKMVEEDSALHTIIASNNEWPIPIDHDDRRFSVFDVRETMKQNDAHFGQLREELRAGGWEAMLYDLMEYQVDDKKLRNPLITEAKSDITAQSLKHIEHWWLEILESGSIQNDTWPTSILKRDLHNSYIEFLERHHKASRERRSTETEMGMFLRKFTPVIQQMTVNGKVERVIQVPSLDECRKTWVKAFNWSASYTWDREWTPPENAGDAWESPARDAVKLAEKVDAPF